MIPIFHDPGHLPNHDAHPHPSPKVSNFLTLMVIVLFIFIVSPFFSPMSPEKIYFLSVLKLYMDGLKLYVFF